jgi:uncharacterized membrane protein
MAWLAYLLPPITGLPAYLKGRDPRTRFHGLQSIVYGFLWPAALFGATYISAAATQIVFGLGGLLWLALLVTTMLGRDLKLPFIADLLTRAAAEAPNS